MGDDVILGGPQPPSRQSSGAATIWKFTLEPWATTLMMPAGARILHAHEQGDAICVWAEVDPEAATVTRTVLAVPTGGRTARGLTYIGTAHLPGFPGPLVFHIYDGGEDDPLES